MLLDELKESLPVYKKDLKLDASTTGIIVVDPVKGFCDKGALSDPARMQPMVRQIDALLKTFPEIKVLIFLDTHKKSEPPYPDHCMTGSGEEEITEDLKWMLRQKRTTIIKKDCINGFIGSMIGSENLLAQWIADNTIETALICGDCTDICVLDLVTTVLSARNHGLPMPPEQEITQIVSQKYGQRTPCTIMQAGLLNPLKDVCVVEKATATYDLPPGIPCAVPHPGDIMHHIGLYLADARGMHCRFFGYREPEIPPWLTHKD